MALDFEIASGKLRFYLRAVSHKAKNWMYSNFINVPPTHIMSWDIEHKQDIVAKLNAEGLTHDG